MKAFLAAMNSTRVIILASFVGAIVMGGLVWAQKQQLADLEFQVGPRGVQALVVELQTKALELANLQRMADREQFKQRDDPEVYVRTAASASRVDIGQVDTAPNERPDTRRRIIDRIITVKPPRGGKTSYSRAQISNFLYKLEADSRRVRVTRIVIRPEASSGRQRPEQVGSDRWDFEADITIRDRLE